MFGKKFDFLKFKRKNLIVAIAVAFIVLFLGSVYTFAKFGFIDLRSLADPVDTTITAHVKDCNNQPVRGISVVIFDLSNNQASMISQGVTNQYGRFVFRNLSPNTNYSVEVSAPPPGYSYDTKSVGTESWGSNTNVNLSIGCPTSGNPITPNTCTSTTDCPAGQWCNLNRQCVSSCSGTGRSTCPEGYVCQSGQCSVNTTNLVSGKIFDHQNVLLSGVEVTIFDRTNNRNVVESTLSLGQNTQIAGGRNYISNSFARTSLSNLSVKYSYYGYENIVLNLDDRDVITGIDGSGNVLTQILRDVRFENMSRQSFYYKVETECRDDVRCPNRNSTGMIDKVPLVITDYGSQITDNAFIDIANHITSGMANGVIRDVNPRNSLEIWVNPSNAVGYIPQYQSIRKPFTPAELWSMRNDEIKKINITSNPNYVPEPENLTILGKITDKDNNSIEANVSLSCIGNPHCSSDFPSPNPKGIKSLKRNSVLNGISHNYKFVGYPNIARPQARLSEFKIRVWLEGHYLDVNNNGQKDPGENGEVILTKNDVRRSPIDNRIAIIEKNFVLRKNSDSGVRISGKVIAKDTNAGVASELKLYKVKNDGSFDQSSVIVEGNDPNSGQYTFSNLENRVDLNADYMLVAEPSPLEADNKTRTYTTEIIKVRFGLSPVLVIDFHLQKNLGSYFVFTGYVQSYYTNGQVQNLVGAEVSATIDGWEIQNAYTHNDSLQYRLEMGHADIFGGEECSESSDCSSSEKEIIELTGFNGKSWQATKHKTYKFEVTKGQGVLIHQDFQFFPSDQRNETVQTKNVKITITKQKKEYNSTYSNGQKPILVGASTPMPFPGVSVQLKLIRSSNPDGRSGYIISSEKKVTGTDGAVYFTGWPRQESKIIVNLPEALKHEGGDSRFVLAQSQTARTINYFKDPWDTERLKNSVDKIIMFQDHGGPWTASDKIPPGHEFSIKRTGCCITAASMALKFYDIGNNYRYPHDATKRYGMDPMLIYEYQEAYQIDGSISNIPSVVRRINRLNGTGFEMEDLKGSLSSARDYLRQGIPVVIHANGMKYHDGYLGHCIVLISYDEGKELYGVLNPSHLKTLGSGRHYHYYLERSQLGRVNSVYAVTSPGARAHFDSVNSSSASNNTAYASGGGIGLARRDSDYSVSANIRSNTPFGINNVFLRYIRPGMPDIYFKMNKNEDDYSFKVPKYVINNNFSYRFLAINDLGAEIESDEYSVSVEPVALTPSVVVSRAFSQMSYSIYNARNNVAMSIVRLRTLINNAFESFRNSFSTFLSRMNIDRTQLVYVRGEVKNVSGELMPGVIVKVWEDAALSADGRFRVNNVKKSNVSVEVVNQLTGENYTVLAPIINVTRNLNNLQIIVDDPADKGSINSMILPRSIPSNERNIEQRVKSGVIKFYRNGVVEKEINLAQTDGRVESLLQSGDYNLKYYLGEEEYNLADSSFSVRKNDIINRGFIVDDRSNFKIRIFGPNRVSCNVYWWGNLNITGPRGYQSSYNSVPNECELNFINQNPGRYNFQFRDNSNTTRVINPAFVDINSFERSRIYEITL